MRYGRASDTDAVEGKQYVQHRRDPVVIPVICVMHSPDLQKRNVMFGRHGPGVPSVVVGIATELEGGAVCSCSFRTKCVEAAQTETHRFLSRRPLVVTKASRRFGTVHELRFALRGYCQCLRN